MATVGVAEHDEALAVAIVDAGEDLVARLDLEVVDVGLINVVGRTIYLRSEPLVPRDVRSGPIPGNGLLHAGL